MTFYNSSNGVSDFVYIGFETGEFVMNSAIYGDTAPGGSGLNYDPRVRSWYLTAKEQPQQLVFNDIDVFVGADDTIDENNFFITISKSFYHSNELYGVIGVDLNKESFVNNFRTTKYNDYTTHMILQGDKAILYDDETFTIHMIEDLYSELDLSFSDEDDFSYSTQKINGKNSLVIIEPIEGKNISFLRIVEVSGLYSDINRNTNIVVYAITLFIGIILLSQYFILDRSVIRPITKVKEKAHTIYETGDYTITFDIENRKDELTDVIVLLNKVFGEVNNYTNKLKESIEEVKRSRIDLITRLGVAAEFKDTDTGLHVVRVAKYCELIANTIGLEDHLVELITLVAPMHDVGKIGIEDKILKKAGKLDEEEFNTMKTHTTIGSDLLKSEEDKLLKFAAIVALQHHEKWNGKGYPIGLKGEEIDIVARICAIADVFDALTSKRAYKEPWSFNKAFELIVSESGQHFDPTLVKAFEQSKTEVFEIYNKYSD